MFILIFFLPRFHFSRFINLRPNALRLFLLTHQANLNELVPLINQLPNVSLIIADFSTRVGRFLFRTIWSARPLFSVGVASWCEKVNILSAFRTELPFDVLWSAQVTSTVNLRLWLFSKIVEVQRVLEALKCPSMCTGSRGEERKQIQEAQWQIIADEAADSNSSSRARKSLVKVKNCVGAIQ